MTTSDDGYRVGRRVGNTIYRDGVFIGSCITPEVAEDLVDAANRGRQATAEAPLPERAPITARNVKLGDRIRLADDTEPVTVSAVRQLPGDGVEVESPGRGPLQLRSDDELTICGVDDP
jgi:hypothetical protein